MSVPTRRLQILYKRLMLITIMVINNIFKALKPGGHLLCLEYEKDDLIIEGPPMSIRIKSVDLEIYY